MTPTSTDDKHGVSGSDTKNKAQQLRRRARRPVASKKPSSALLSGQWCELRGADFDHDGQYRDHVDTHGAQRAFVLLEANRAGRCSVDVLLVVSAQTRDSSWAWGLQLGSIREHGVRV
ncbi:hypothetical protein PHYSODRAFT_325032 [Phytophthora sojae]|uniref:Uncharacterized protein n=1 Tax=Phytophthora sojae (strain P6497) TaxID=1094619 RepID=G4YXJ4_PHYSP|nr:hypothetical protein PHYSODRAFT_325031 [Phytophthora sojae]XP_009519144.1 hypothetical protein PHYSODRAFT_325032 [Phytophthora sojae]EGZ23855.1 hypothetical protein PHYSODRAFT_325031 [Phytophthora sojae]EGZ23856.1 hypothetical protein PHYSODRAFT_325032 [Phytophthora sojae]|eukprot:XP_009519143.1 hypothetical protein PHYSODRAFT_325031 [Phytophthora sojae]